MTACPIVQDKTDSREGKIPSLGTISKEFEFGSRWTQEKTMTKEFVTLSELLNRGWSKPKINPLLGDPDLIRTNPRYRNASPMLLYRLSRVSEYEENNDNWRKNKRKSAASLNAAEVRAAKLLETVSKLEISIPLYNAGKVRADAIAHYNDRNDARYASKNSDEVFLARITLNYIRHQLVDYDAVVNSLYGLVGKNEAYAILKDRVNEKARNLYPTITPAS